MISFYLNGQLIEEHNVTSEVTLLRYLRTRKNLVGTKEGCGTGDCGACTVLVGEYSCAGSVSDHQVNDYPVNYEAINSCITLLSQINGKSLITVEGLASPNGLHPAQQSMVDYHGSQCGFCTPGIVMSLAALHQKQKSGYDGDSASPGIAPPTEHDILDALSGNLCRCTGYRPIIDAARNMYRYEAGEKAKPGVNVWQPGPKPSAEDISIPVNESQLKALLQQYPEARLVAGATDLAIEIAQRQLSGDRLISIRDIADLRCITVDDDTITIGAAATYTEMEPVLVENYPEFAALLKRLGSRQVRNHGTLGGNIGNASPIGDTPPVLIALGASIEIASINGCRWMPIDQFFIDYKKTALKAGEYIRMIRIPRLADQQSLKVYKISKRLEDDISAVLVAFLVTVNNGTMTAIGSGFGGMAGIPKAARHVEQALINKPLTEQTFMDAATELPNDFTPMSDVRASADYRMKVAKGLMRKCALELLQPAALSRIEDVHAHSVSDGEISSSMVMQYTPTVNEQQGGDHA